MGCVVTSGKIAGQVVDQIRLDPGTDRMIVKSSLVSEEMKTGQTIMMKGYAGNISAHPPADVELEVGDQKTILTVALQGELNYDVLLGADFPHIWELGRQLLYTQTVHLVQTRVQTKAADVVQQRDQEVDENSKVVEKHWQLEDSGSDLEPEMDDDKNEESHPDSPSPDLQQKSASRSVKRVERCKYRDALTEELIQ